MTTLQYRNIPVLDLNRRAMAANGIAHEIPEGMYRGGYKSKLNVAKIVIQDYQEVILALRAESAQRASYLKKCYSALCMTWTHIQRHTTSGLLEGVFPTEAIDPSLISAGSVQEHADGIIKVAISLLAGVKDLAEREVELENEITLLKDKAYDAMCAEPTDIPSPLFRSYDLLVKALEESPPASSAPRGPLKTMDESDEDETNDYQFPTSGLTLHDSPPATPPDSPLAAKTGGSRTDKKASSSRKEHKSSDKVKSSSKK